MANDTGDLIDAADLESPNLNPAYSLDPTYGIRAVPLTTKEVFPETSSALMAPLSTTYTPPGTRVASLAAVPGQPVNLMQGADLTIPQPQVRPVIPPGSEAPQVQLAQNGGVAPPLRSPQPPPGSVTERPEGAISLPRAAQNPPETDATQKELDQAREDGRYLRQQGWGQVRQFLDADGANESKEAWKKNQEKIQQLEQKVQTQNTAQNMARNYHLLKPTPNTADAASIPEQAIEEMRKDGNIGAYTALLGSPHADRAKGYTSEFMNAAGKDVVKANDLFEKLNNAQTQPDYVRERDKLLKGAKDVTNAQYFGMTEGNIPTTQGEWVKRRELIQGPVKSATQLVNNYVQQQKDQLSPKPVTDAGVSSAVTGDSTKVAGQVSPHAKARSLPAQGGAYATLYDNSTADIRDYGEGKKWNDFGFEQRQTAAKMITENPEIKGVLDQHNMALKFNEIVQDDANYKDSTGRTIIADSAAGVFRNMSEMARAAGNIGLIRVLEHEMGFLEKTMNQAYTNWGTYKDWMDGGSKGEAPELVERSDQWTPQTKQAFKRIGQFNLDAVGKTLDRASGVASYVGEHGGSLEGVGGISKEAAKVLKPYRDAAEQQHRLDLDSRDRLIINGRHYELGPDHTIDPKTPGFVPAGSYKESVDAVVNNSRPPPPPPQPQAPAANIAPGQVQRVVAPPPGPPPTNAPSSFGGRFDALGGVTTPPSRPIPPAPPPAAPAPGRRSMLDAINPITPAQAESAPAPDAEALRQTGLAALRGQQPEAPAAPAPAAPPAYEPQSYKAGLGRGESNNNYAAPPPRNKAGEQLSTASGKYQMIDETWNRVKPPGATATRAMDATPAQQEAANDHLIIENSNALQKAGLPVNNFTLSVAHQLGVGKGGASSLLTAPDSDTALKYVDRKAAAKNPSFFWEGGDGRLLTVAESKAKYASFYQTGGAASPKPIGDMTLSELHKEARERKAAGVPQRGEADKSALQGIVQRGAADAIPAATQTAGQIAGAPFGPAGVMAGGAIGRAVGDPARDYLSGDLDKQDASHLALSAGGGLVQGALESTPFGGLAGTGSRVVGAPVVAGLTDYLQTNDPKHALNKGLFTAAGSVVGEGAGLAINKAVAPYLERLPIADHGPVKNAAEVIATQKAVTIDAAGNQVGNPAYMTAEGYLRSKGIDPKRIAADYEATAKGSTEFGPAVVNRPAEAARLDAAHELQQVPNAVGAAHANTPMGQRAGLNARIGRDVVNPVDAVISDTNPHGSIPRGMEEHAKAAQDTMFKPSTNYGEAVDNMAKARSDVLEKIRNTERIPAEAGDAYTNKSQTIKGLTALADHIRTQQETIIKHTLPPAQADALIEHLHQAGERYQRAVAAGGKDIVATIAKGGKEGNDARNAFMAVAKNDAGAQRWMNAMVEAEKNKGGKGKDLIYIMTSTAGAAGAIPYVGTPAKIAIGSAAAAISLPRIKSLWDNYMTMKAAGKLVDFSQLVRDNVTPYKKNIQSAASTLGGTVGGDVGDELLRKKPTVENRGARVPVSQ